MKERIPFGWALDARGVPTDDPEAALVGTLVPIGEYKGYGLAFFIDLISGLLSGSKYSRDLKTFHRPEGPTGVGVMTMAVDIQRFMPTDHFAHLVEEHIRAIRTSKKAQDSLRIYLPGEIEFERESSSRRQGVEIDAPIVEAIDALLEKMDLAIRLKDGEMGV
jgi:LDH2 family malate/lactate/ureidoglycolate dehydrogenase